MSTPTDGRRIAVRDVSFARDTHAGLWLDRYLPALRQPKGDDDQDGAAGEALRRLLEDTEQTSVPFGYKCAEERRRSLLEFMDGGVEGGVTRMFAAEAQGRVIIGLGAASLRETNVSLLHTWGVPFLPGSALKGLALASARRLATESVGTSANAGAERQPAKKGSTEATAELLAEERLVLFGTTRQAGYVVFHDAWWIPDVRDSRLPLDLDVMTVHHPDYYRSRENAPPADWDEPTPVPFLTARGRYGVALSGPEDWVGVAAELLRFGLCDLGIGAKTSAGYGRMTLVPQLTARDRERQASLERLRAMLIPLERLPAQHKGANTAKQHVQQLRNAIADGVPSDRVYEIARQLYRRDPKFWDGWMKDQRRTEDERAFLVESGMRRGEVK